MKLADKVGVIITIIIWAYLLVVLIDKAVS